MPVDEVQTELPRGVLPQELAEQQKRAKGQSQEENERSMRAYMADLRSRTMEGRDGRLHGPLQPCTIINFNPVEMSVGGQIRHRIPTVFDFPKAKTVQKIERGGRVHIGMWVTFSEGIPYMTTTGHNERIDLHWAEAKYAPRCLTPMEIAWHFWSKYSTEQGDAQKMGGVLVFDGTIDEVRDERELNKRGRKIFVPESYIIPDTRGVMGVRLRPAILDDEMDRLVTMQAEFVGAMAQRAEDYFNDKDPVQRKQITNVMRRWGNFGVEMRYLEERKPWMLERPDADSDAGETRACPVCHTGSRDTELLVSPCCKAPYDEMCTIEAVRKGVPIAESWIDALSAESHKKLMTVLEEQSRRRAERGALMGTEKPKK